LPKSENQKILKKTRKSEKTDFHPINAFKESFIRDLMALSLEGELDNLRLKEAGILASIDERNKRKKIDCEGCHKSHQIKNLVLIQTRWYTPPSGCTEGDYWNEGEMQFICPETNVINRLLFFNDDVPYGERRNYENDPEEQFRRNYKSLFKEIVESCGETPEPWKNNYYANQNRKKFGLVEKRKSSS